jgi:uncharacterized protein (TIGR02145 family)
MRTSVMRVKEMTKNQGIFKITLGLAMAALFLASCDSGSKGSDPQVEDSSSSVTDPTSSGSVIASSGSVITSSSSAKSSSSTQINSSSSVIGSSGSTQGSSSSFVCEEGRIQYLTLAGVKVYYICEGNAWVAMPVSSSSAVVVSSSSVASSSSYYNMDSTFNSELSYGEFTDPRDGQKYKTIVIPYENFEYFAENLNYGKQVSLTKGQKDSTKYCYNDDSWYCDNHFGGLYRWSTAMGFPAACDSVETGSSAACLDTVALSTEYMEPEFYVQHRGICPEGWHVMNEGEWSNILGGGAWKIESEAGWNDDYNNTTGFSALPGGRLYSYQEATFEYMGTKAFFWLPQEQSEDALLGARSVTLSSTDANNTSHSDFKTNGLSVRCVRDHEGI